VDAVSAAAIEPTTTGRLTRTRGMTVNALSLVVATVAANVLGLGFWAAASHLRDAADVGRASAAVSALILLATIAQLNLPNVFLRFLPAAGTLSGRFVGRSYLAVCALALAAGLVYVLSGLSSGVLVGGWAERAVFVISVGLCAIFALQDGVLTALRLTWWVPIENSGVAMAKLAVLPGLLFLPATLGIVVAWMVPVAIAVLGISALLFRRVLPERGQVAGTLPPRRRLASFVAAEYAGTLCATAAMQAMPLLVVWKLGAADNAYFTLPWLVWMAMMSLLGNILGSLVVEIVTKPEAAAHALRRGVAMWGGLVAAALLCCTAGAPIVLSLSGGEYAAQGSELLRLIGLSAPFASIAFAYTAFAWLEQRVWRLALIQLGTGALLVTVSLLLLPSMGLVAIGWANLLSQIATAAAMTPSLWRRLRTWRRTGVLPVDLRRTA
jgi:O-antigen/teichoic acid export membrane protein